MQFKIIKIFFALHGNRVFVDGNNKFCPSAAAFWGFSRGGFPENACIGGTISERNFCEICRRKSPQNTEKHKQSSAQRFLNDPFPKTPFCVAPLGGQSSQSTMLARDARCRSVYWQGDCFARNLVCALFTLKAAEDVAFV